MVYGRCLSLFLLLVSTLVACPALGQRTISYPETRRVDHVDEYHGVRISDPYRWLEEDVRESSDVAQWVTEQNRITSDYLSQIAYRDGIEKRLTELWDYEKYTAPFKQGGRYFYSKNDGLQNQSVLYTMTSLDDEPLVLLDPNTWSEDGTVALAGVSVSDDGRYLAYATADAGSDWSTWHVLDIDQHKLLDDRIRWVKFSTVAWTNDSRGFFYSRYPEPREGEAYQSLNLNQTVCYHRLGSAQSEDAIVCRRPDQPQWGFNPTVTEDGRYLVITVWKGTDDKFMILYRDLEDPYAMPVELIERFENAYEFIGNDGRQFFFKTDKDAPRGRIVAIDLTRPAVEHWRELVPQAENTLTAVTLVGNLFVANYLRDARSEVKVFGLDGSFVRSVDLPGIGTANGFSGQRTDTETFYAFTTFTTPPVIYRYDMISGQSRKLREAHVLFHPGDYEVEQVFYESGGGVRVPMFIAYRKGLKRDGSNPTLLYGYGGFNVSLTPNFSPARLAWMEMGGLFAMPNLRGGGEYGEEWHVAGKLEKKQNVFDDFIAAAEWLIENRYTRPDRLAIQGHSNGGLLVGACMTQRPELFGACLPGVGVMDMLRFHKFTAGRFWVDEYGSSDDEQMFSAIRKYSPYHAIKKGTAYPATLVTTADTDDRVVPGHSFKFAAALQHAHAGEAPVLIRIETRAGHGAGKPTRKLIEETADQFAFLIENLAMHVSL